VRASTRLTEAAKALATRDHVRGISGLSALSNIMFLRLLVVTAKPLLEVGAPTRAWPCQTVNCLHAPR